ncbi:MAG: hypothetical protein IJS46_05835 [Kiritimatiellae bacterium]|nr:hypothetical protein [Kiritimatiellia bacterium]
MSTSRFHGFGASAGTALAVAVQFCLPCAAEAQARAAEPPRVSSSLSVVAKMEKGEFVRGETVAVSGTLRNGGDEAFVIDDYGDYVRNSLKVYVFDEESGRMILPRAGAPSSAVDAIVVMPGGEKTFSIDIGSLYDLPRQGRFQAAVVATRGGTDGAPDESASSRRMAFSVVDGIALASAARARTRDGSGGRSLLFSLVYWDQASRQNLFLRVSDAATGDIVAFFRLGAFIRMAEPSLAFGQDDTAVVVQQISRDRFAKTVVCYAAGKEGIVSRDDNLVSADAISESISTRLVNERVDRVFEERRKEQGGFFRRHKTRIPASTGNQTSP